MDKPISVGDLVMVIKPTQCCGSGKHIGEIFTYLGTDDLICRCPKCGHQVLERTANLSDGTACEFIRLKRIPPLSEFEDVKVHETIGA